MTEKEKKVEVAPVETSETPEVAEQDAESTEVKEEKTKEELLTEENAALKDSLLRKAAELENLRKRHQKEVDDVRKYSSSSFAKEMLAVLDNMSRAVESLDEVETDDESLRSVLDGVKMVSQQLENIFKQAGIKKIVSKGKMLNPEFHQAMSQVESEEKSGTIVEVFQEGYTMHGRLLRPALVIVSK
ncbi:MAG: nucleotide exchange factor GrpE [Proteobacteria bacterium]|nr:nucleotide exchange factor GrpE [Pseudomonadota bacterium]